MVDYLDGLDIQRKETKREAVIVVMVTRLEETEEESDIPHAFFIWIQNYIQTSTL